MRNLIICSCGASAWVHNETPDRKSVCENPQWRFGKSTSAYRLGMTRAEIERIPPQAAWHCGTPGHFQLIVCDAFGGFLYAIETELYPAHITPEMLGLIAQARAGVAIPAMNVHTLV